jgi:polyhydroxyalkanoate synthesis repressor PhaR
MPLIKRYANRKLYDTETKRYVTLDDLAAFIRQGQDVRVVDHATGEDLTSQTLFQIIFEEEKKIGGLLPQLFLTRLIRAGGSTLGALRSRLLAIDPFQTVDEEIRRRLQSLLDRSLLTPEEAARLQSLLIYHSTPPGAVTIPVPSEEPVDPQEVQALLHQIAALEQELDLLKQ